MNIFKFIFNILFNISLSFWIFLVPLYIYFTIILMSIIPGRESWLSHIQNTFRWNYSAWARRHVSIYWLGFYVLIFLPSLRYHPIYLNFFLSNYIFVNLFIYLNVYLSIHIYFYFLSLYRCFLSIRLSFFLSYVKLSVWWLISI